MRLFRFALNTWITIASIGSFLVGWVALAHAPKPVQHTQQTTITNAAPLPTLTPLQNLQFGQGGSSSFQSFQAPSGGFNNAFNSSPQPLFRTGGS